jgi:hypothetical protein
MLRLGTAREVRSARISCTPTKSTPITPDQKHADHLVRAWARWFFEMTAAWQPGGLTCGGSGYIDSSEPKEAISPPGGMSTIARPLIS